MILIWFILLWVFKRNRNEIYKLEMDDQSVKFTFVNNFLYKRKEEKMDIAAIRTTYQGDDLYLHNDTGVLFAILRKKSAREDVWVEICVRLKGEKGW